MAEETDAVIIPIRADLSELEDGVKRAKRTLATEQRAARRGGGFNVGTFAAGAVGGVVGAAVGSASSALSPIWELLGNILVALALPIIIEFLPYLAKILDVLNLAEGGIAVMKDAIRRLVDFLSPEDRLGAAAGIATGILGQGVTPEAQDRVNRLAGSGAPQNSFLDMLRGDVGGRPGRFLRNLNVSPGYAIGREVADTAEDAWGWLTKDNPGAAVAAFDPEFGDAVSDQRSSAALVHPD